MVSVCLPSCNINHLTWVSLTLDVRYLLTAAPPDLERGIAPLGPPAPTQPLLLGCGVMVERSDRMWSTGEGNGKPLQYSCLENPMNSMNGQNDKILKEEHPRLVGDQYATGDQ